MAVLVELVYREEDLVAMWRWADNTYLCMRYPFSSAYQDPQVQQRCLNPIAARNYWHAYTGEEPSCLAEDIAVYRRRR